MKADQKFNAIIEKVETYFTQTAIPKSREIADSIARSEGMLYREFNAAFQFLTGVSFKEYINERRMDLAYEWLVKMDEFGWDDVIEISGFGDANSFSKAFKKYYSMTPKDAFNKKNRDLIKGPLSWAKLSSANEQINTINDEEDRKMSTTYLGISKEDFEMVLRARDLQLLYSFNDEQTDAAYRVAKQNGVLIDRAFDYIEAYCIYWHYNENNSLFGEFDEFAKEIVVDDEDIAYAYCNLKLSISEALMIRDEIRDSKYTMKDITRKIISDAGYHPDLSYKEIIECYKLANRNTDMSLVLEAMDDGLDPEEAIDYEREWYEQIRKSDHDLMDGYNKIQDDVYEIREEDFLDACPPRDWHINDDEEWD